MEQRDREGATLCFLYVTCGYVYVCMYVVKSLATRVYSSVKGRATKRRTDREEKTKKGTQTQLKKQHNTLIVHTDIKLLDV